MGEAARRDSGNGGMLKIPNVNTRKINSPKCPSSNKTTLPAKAGRVVGNEGCLVDAFQRTPLPFRATSKGDLAPSLLDTISFAVRLPTADGLNVTLNVVVAPAARDVFAG